MDINTSIKIILVVRLISPSVCKKYNHHWLELTPEGLWSKTVCKTKPYDCMGVVKK